jgi:excisionase family DNA binding protein
MFSTQPVATQSVSRGISIREYAELNGVCESTVKRAIREGKIPAYRVGKSRRIPLSHLEQLQRNDPIEAEIERIVSAAPPLTDDQRNRIAALLRTGGAA